MEFNGTFLISAISFIVFVFIMNLIFYKPIEKIVNERKSLIDDNFDEAQKNNLNAEKLINERDKKVFEANSKGKNIMDEKTNEAKNTKANLILKAHNDASKKSHNNQEELKTACKTTKDELNQQVENLAKAIEEKLFCEN